MPAPGQIDEDELPGIGRRYTFGLPDDGQICVVIHHTGRRDLYVTADVDDDEGGESVSVEDDVARRLGAVIAGSYFTPAAVKRVEAVIGGLLIDWVTVREGSALAGSSIADAGVRQASRMTVAAIVRGDASIVAPEPEEVVAVGDQLVVMGRPEDLAGFLDQFIN
jgi:TrkA domain protein